MIDNFRNVGLPTSNNIIWRSSCLDNYLGSDELSTIMTEKQIRTVIDLRRPHEYNTDAEHIIRYRHFLHELEIHYVNYPFGDFDDLGVRKWQGYQFAQDHHNLFYEWVVWHQFYVFKDLLRLIILYPKPMVIHCTACRDRTGMIVAIFQEITGVERAKIIDDYSLSTDADRSNIELFFTTCDAQGGIEQLLLDYGLEPEELVRLKELLR